MTLSNSTSSNDVIHRNTMTCSSAIRRGDAHNSDAPGRIIGSTSKNREQPVRRDQSQMNYNASLTTCCDAQATRDDIISRADECVSTSRGRLIHNTYDARRSTPSAPSDATGRADAIRRRQRITSSDAALTPSNAIMNL